MDYSAIGPSAASVIVVIFFLKYLADVNTSNTGKDELFAKAISGITKSTEKTNREVIKEARLTRAVQERGFNEAKERNGHLAEIAAENQRSNQENQMVMLKAIRQIKEQTVMHQTVRDQTIEWTED